jgi:hypothetical protein
MTDEKYTLISDIKSKKAAARGAFARKGGSRSKRCSLPSDNLTPAQLKRRNSQVTTVKLNQPITYAELQTLTPSLKFLYLDNLIHHYKARRIDLVTMLKITQRTFSKMAEALPGKLTFEGKPKHPAPEWLEFIGGRAEEIVPEDVRDLPAPDPIVEVQPVEIEQPFIPQPPVLPDRIDLSITGTPAQLIDLLSLLTEADKTYSFRLSFNK